MLVPSKYENVNKNLLVIGAEIIAHLKKRTYAIEELYQDMKQSSGIGIEQYFDGLTFLWLSDILILDGFQINLTMSNL